MKHKIVIHPPKKLSSSKFQPAILDKVEKDMLTLAEYLYFNDPKSKGNEESFNLVGITHQGASNEMRVVTRVGHGKTENSTASVTTIADTIEAIDDRAKNEGSEIVGAGHLHTFPDGHRFLSQTDKDTMKAYGAIDPGYLFIVINPLSSEYTVYHWDNDIDDAVEVHPKIVKTMPLLIKDEQQKIIIRKTKQILNPRILETIRRIVRDSTLIFSTSMTILFIILFSLGSTTKPELLLYSILCILGYVNLSSLFALWSIDDELRKN